MAVDLDGEWTASESLRKVKHSDSDGLIFISLLAQEGMHIQQNKHK